MRSNLNLADLQALRAAGSDPVSSRGLTLASAPDRARDAAGVVVGERLRLAASVAVSAPRGRRGVQCVGPQARWHGLRKLQAGGGEQAPPERDPGARVLRG